MDNIQVIKKAVDDERKQMRDKLAKLTGEADTPTVAHLVSVQIGKMLTSVGVSKARTVVRQGARGARMKTLLRTLDTNAARKAQIEFAAECARCCGEYWFEMLMQPIMKGKEKV